MLRTVANMLATGLLFLGLLHSLEVFAPARAVDGKQSWFQQSCIKCSGGEKKTQSKCLHAGYDRVCGVLCLLV